MLSYFISLVPSSFTPYSLKPLKRSAGPSAASSSPRAPLPTISRDESGRWAFDPVAVAEPESPAPAPFTPMPSPAEWLLSKRSSPTSSLGFATPSLTSSAETTPASSAAPSPQQPSRSLRLRSLARPRDSINLAPDFGFAEAVQAKLRLAMAAEEEKDATGLGFNFAVDGSIKWSRC